MTIVSPDTLFLDRSANRLKKSLYLNAEPNAHRLLHTTPEVNGIGCVEVLTPFGPARSRARWISQEKAWYIRIKAPFFQMLWCVADQPGQAAAAAWEEIGQAYAICYTTARDRGARGPAEYWAGAARQAFLASAALNL